MIKRRADRWTTGIEARLLSCCGMWLTEPGRCWKLEYVLTSCCRELKPRPQMSLMRPQRSAALSAGQRITDHNTEADLVSSSRQPERAASIDNDVITSVRTVCPVDSFPRLFPATAATRVGLSTSMDKTILCSAVNRFQPTSTEYMFLKIITTLHNFPAYWLTRTRRIAVGKLGVQRKITLAEKLKPARGLFQNIYINDNNNK